VTRTVPRLAVAAALTALLVAGCGRDEEVTSGQAPAAKAQPSATPYSTKVTGTDTRPKVRMSGSVRQRLDAGDIAVVDFVARAGIAPSTMQLNKEQQLQEIRWSDWGSPSASGSARVRSLVCDPSCGRGRFEMLDGKVELSDVRLCGARRYYARATLETTDPKTGEAGRPATYLRTPC
jgi:hypothetical protein